MFVAFSFLLLIQLKGGGGGGVFVVVVSGMNGLFQYSFFVLCKFFDKRSRPLQVEGMMWLSIIVTKIKRSKCSGKPSFRLKLAYGHQ